MNIYKYYKHIIINTIKPKQSYIDKNTILMLWNLQIQTSLLVFKFNKKNNHVIILFQRELFFQFFK